MKLIKRYENEISELEKKLMIEKARVNRIYECWLKINHVQIEKGLSKLKLKPIRESQYNFTNAQIENFDECRLFMIVYLESEGSIKGVKGDINNMSGTSIKQKKYAIRLQDRITKACGYKCYINEYSMNAKSGNEPFRFAAEFVIS